MKRARTHTHTHTQAARRIETTRLSANNADTNYQESIRNLEEARQLWEREMEILCRVCTHRCLIG